ncbi:MAG TPA: polysaccharide lyase family protein, partial [Fodinibius sp.]|nr:polysaccharide lyase family protein [Fodinibius sp.]
MIPTLEQKQNYSIVAWSKVLIWILFIVFANTSVSYSQVQAGSNILFKIGDADDRSVWMALAPDSYEDFLKNDFGWEDRYFLAGHSNTETDWPYVLPGPEDHWGGTWSTSGIRSHTLNILFGMDEKPRNGNWEFIVDVLGYNRSSPPLVKVTVNGVSWKYQLPEGKGDSTLVGDLAGAEEYKIEIPVDQKLLKTGGNEINVTTIQGSWLLFDQVKLEGPGDVELEQPNSAFVRDVQAAQYEISNRGNRYQPLL